MPKIFRVLVLALALLTIGAACAKKKNDVNKVAPDAYIGKAELEGKTFSYSKTIMSANEELDTIGAIPGVHSDMGFVRFVVTEKALQVRRVDEVNRDDESASIVASFPIEKHFDIRRARNDFGEETNQIEENTERPWNEREFMRVNWGNNTIKSTSLNKIFGSEILTEDSTVVSELKKEGGLIEFNVDATVEHLPWQSIKGNGDEHDGGYGALRAQVKNSFLEVRQTDFTARAKREMPNEEFHRFGYFRTFENFINPDKGFTVSGKKHYANKFNVCENNASTAGLSCATNKIVFVLNKGFDDEFLDMARRSVKVWNETFKKALGRTDDVVVLDESIRPEVGDPRYNMIAGINERVPTGLLGISQTVNNPHTGETIMARSSVYMGTVKLLGGIAVEQLAIMEEEEALGVTGIAAGKKIGHVKIKTGGLVTGTQFNHRKMSLKSEKPQPLAQSLRGGFKALEALKKTLPRNTLQSTEKRLHALKTYPSLFSPGDSAWTRGSGDMSGKSALQENLLSMEGLLDVNHLMGNEKNRLAQEAKHGIHYAENVEVAIQNYIIKFKAANPGLEGDALKDALRRHVRALVFYQTLIHEMGHNFGLRHNFGSSTDKKNYTAEYWNLEKQRQAIANDPKLPADVKAQKIAAIKLEQGGWDYTSVMDYTDEFYELQGGPGNYDLAAIRFGYNTSIDTKADPITGVVRNLKFCTDHSVYEDALCQRFDKGSNLNKIVEVAADRYEKSYIMRNFRRDRIGWGSVGSHMGSVMMRYMLPARLAVDEFILRLVLSPRNPSGSGACQFEVIARSIRLGEMANFCDPKVIQEYAEKGLQLTSDSDLGIFLRNPDTLEFLSDPDDYEALGFADLVLANEKSSNFFVGIIGSPEPGDFIAMPEQGIYKLVSLPRVSGDETANIEAFKSANNVDEDTEELRSRIVTFRPGPNGKYLYSRYDANNFNQLERMGYIYDKIAAFSIMSMQGLPLDKFSDQQLLLNFYTAFQQKTTTLGLVNALVSNEKHFMIQPVRLRSGEIVAASPPAALSQDTQTLSVIYSLIDFVRMEDQSFVDKMRICNEGDAACANVLGAKTVSMVSASGTETFKVVQVVDGDSIAYNLLSKGVVQNNRRLQAAKDLTDLPNLLNFLKEEAVTKLEDKVNSRKTLEEAMTKVNPNLTKALDGILGAGDRDGSPTLWQLIMNEGAKGAQANGALGLRIQEVFADLKPQIEGLVTAVVAGHPDGEATVTALNKVLNDMKVVNDLTVRSVASDEIIADAASEIADIDQQARVIRDVMLKLDLR